MVKEPAGACNIPRTSIIMPVYGTATTVVRAIDSVRSQTDPDFELIVINDKSQDDAREIIIDHLYKCADYRIRFMENEKNIGLASSRNRGMEEAQGEWVSFLDSDDAYKPEFLETMHRNTFDVDVVIAAHDVLYQDGTQRYRQRGVPGTYFKEYAQIMALRDELTPYAWDKIFRKSAVGNLRFPVINRVEDAGFCIPMMGQAKKIRIIPESLYVYSVNPQSITWGSVPPISESYKFLSYLKDTTGVHKGIEIQRDAFAVTWVLNFLNSAQSALRLQPQGSKKHIKQCRKAMKISILMRCLRTRPVFGIAGIVLKIAPVMYTKLYKTYVRRSYGL